MTLDCVGLIFVIIISFFSYIHISQGSVEMHLRCGMLW